MKITSLFSVFIGFTFTIPSCTCQITTNHERYTRVIKVPENRGCPVNMMQNRGCPVNMMRYPSTEEKSGWICDCCPGLVFFKGLATCHRPFTQGPCPKRYYVNLGASGEPSCMKNPCAKENELFYRGRCGELGASGGPCQKNEELVVNDTSFQLKCDRKISRPLSIITAPKRQCPAGSRRNTMGICKTILR